MRDFIKNLKSRWKERHFFKACKKGYTDRVKSYLAVSYDAFDPFWIDDNLIVGALLAIKHSQHEALNLIIEQLTGSINLHATIRYLMAHNNLVLLDLILEKKYRDINLSKTLEIAVEQSAKNSFHLVISKFGTVINADIAYCAFNCASEDVMESDPDEPNKSYYLRELGKFGIIPVDSFQTSEVLTATYGEADSMEYWPDILPLELNMLLLRRYLNAIGTTPMAYLSMTEEKHKPALLALISSK